jgi:hypothetical protein
MPKQPHIITPEIAATRALVPDSVHRVRLSRLHGVDDHGTRVTRVIYEGPDKIYIQRAPDGRVVVVTTQDQGWAEGDERDTYLRDGKLSFVVEDYLLEILD